MHFNSESPSLQSFGVMNSLDFAKGILAADGSSYDKPIASPDAGTCGEVFLELGPQKFASCESFWKANGFTVNLLTSVLKHGSPSFSGTVIKGAWRAPALALDEAAFSSTVSSEIASGFYPSQVTVIPPDPTLATPARFTAAFVPTPGSDAVHFTSLARSSVVGPYSFSDLFFRVEWGWYISDIHRYSGRALCGDVGQEPS